MRYLRTRKAATDFGIIIAVGLFFVAGVFFESRRTSGRLPEVAGEVGAATVPTATPANETASADDLLNSEDLSGVPEPTVVAVVKPTARPVFRGTPDPEAVGQTVFLEISGIENETVIEASTVAITGATTPDALLSVNGQTVQVELDGSFAIDFDLEPGPNFVEFVSSNLRGQEASRVISVVSIQ